MAGQRPWLVMLYLAGDDIPLKGGIGDTLSHAVTRLIDRWLYDPDRIRGLAENTAMHLVILVDGYFLGDKIKEKLIVADGKLGPQRASLMRTCSRLFYLGPNGLEEHADVLRTELKGYDDQINSGYDGTLTRFIRWAQRTYPGKKTMLSLVGHGGGWSPDTGNPGAPPVHPDGSPGWGICVDDRAGYALSTRGLTRAIDDAIYPKKKLDILFFDACLMGTIECAYEVRQCADYLIAGQNWLWAELPYERYLDPELLDKKTTPCELAINIVANYNRFNERIAPLPFTLAVIDLRQMDDLRKRVEHLASLLYESCTAPAEKEQNKEKIREIYMNVQKFDGDADLDIDWETEFYVDLHDLACRIEHQSISDDVSEAARKVREKIGARRILRFKGEDGIEKTRTGTDLCRDKIDPYNNGIDPCGDKSDWGEDHAVLVVYRRSASTLVPPQTGAVIHHDLQAARGLSIYMPLGGRDLRPPTADPEATEKDAIDWLHKFYVTGNHLTFTAEGHARSWARLLGELMQRDKRDLPTKFIKFRTTPLRGDVDPGLMAQVAVQQVAAPQNDTPQNDAPQNDAPQNDAPQNDAPPDPVQ